MALHYQKKLLPDGTPNPRYTLRSRWNSTRDRHKSEHYRAQFIGIDGEGYTDNNGRHHYVFLANSEGLSIDNFDSGNTLSTEACFNFLLSSKRKSHYLVCYGASYDVNMMLGDVPIDKLKELHTKNQCYWRDWSITYIPHKLLQLTKFPEKKSVTLYDVLGFFQFKFTKAISDWLGPNIDGLSTVIEGKAKRSQFGLDEASYIRYYCSLELRLLVQLMERLSEYLESAGIRLKRWIGAGAIASFLLNKHGIKEHIADTLTEHREVYDAARGAYAGGRIELLQYGHYEGPIYHYDLNSAYVAPIPTLPSLKDAQWRWVEVNGKAKNIPDFSLVYIEYKAYEQRIFYPFFHRTKSGRIYYPRNTKGWHWGVEVNVGKSFLTPKDKLHVRGYWTVDNDAIHPFRWVSDMYDIRKAWKHEGNAAHIVIKLGLNSLYGKFVQHVGGDAERRKLPAFHQLEWAGYITAYTRSKLYAACMKNPSAIIAMQTDGIFSTEPLDLEFGDGLGQWSKEDECKSGTWVQSGVYWLETDRERLPFYRGFDEGTLSETMVLEGWKQHTNTLSAMSTRFVTFGGICVSDAYIEKWRTWHTTSRELNLNPAGSKRQDIIVTTSERESGKRGLGDYEPWRELVPTEANDTYQYRERDASDESYPYSLPWDAWDEPESTRIDGMPAREYKEDWEVSQV